MTCFLFSLLLLVLLFFLTYWPAHVARRKKKVEQPPDDLEADLVETLLGLGEGEIEELFRLYRAQFGAGPARYARKTYRKWRTRQVYPSPQTFERLLVHLPKVMSFDLKCEVLRRLRLEYCARDDYELTVYTDDWRETLGPVVASAVEKAQRASLPERVARRLDWLAAGEMRAAEALLAESQARESRATYELMETEMAAMERLLEESGGTGRVTHTLRLPCATIRLDVRRRSDDG